MDKYTVNIEKNIKNKKVALLDLRFFHAHPFIGR